MSRLTVTSFTTHKQLYHCSQHLHFTSLPPIFRREGNVFIGVCPSTGGWGVGGRGTPVPSSFPGLWFQVHFGWRGGGGRRYPMDADLLTNGQDAITQSPSIPSRQDRRESTCCTAGGTPLAVTQDDFLV